MSTYKNHKKVNIRQKKYFDESLFVLSGLLSVFFLTINKLSGNAFFNCYVGII